MKIGLVSQLECPICHKEFTIKRVKKIKNEIKEGILICSNKHSFKVSNGVPRFVIDTTKDFVRTEDAFSAKWVHHHENHHAKDWIKFQTKWFLERYEWGSLKKFNEFLKTKTKILDAGTGIGNSAKLLSANQDSEVFALDASQSIDFAYKKYGNLPNVHFLQADLRQLPFKRSFFDFIKRFILIILINPR